MSQNTLSYVTIDVFTKTRYIGNPLAMPGGGKVDVTFRRRGIAFGRLGDELK